MPFVYPIISYWKYTQSQTLRPPPQKKKKNGNELVSSILNFLYTLQLAKGCANDIRNAIHSK